ncbi:MAG: hypothetical protein K2K37_02270 [Muribaculaceae bacterium]|nr:hypothetical protein [Muribaculaceae bacterium]
MKRYLTSFAILLQTMMWGAIMTACSSDEPSGHDPIDDFAGPYYRFILGHEAEGLQSGTMQILIQAPDGTEFQRTASHVRSGAQSDIRLSDGLKEGTYRLLAAIPADNTDDDLEFGLGSRIEVSNEGIKVIDTYNPQLGFAGGGTQDDPYIVSSPSHLFNLMMAVNDYDSNPCITSGTYFSQVRNLDMKSVSRNCDLEYGWIPIGADANTPFRGVYLGGGHSISNLMINRPASAGIGLFGYVIDTAIDGVNMKHCNVSGMYGTGTIVGVALTSGGVIRGKVSLTNCSAEDCILECPATSAAVGGLIGAIDMHSMGLVSSCSVKTSTLSGGMNVGGLIGGAGLYSALTATDVECSGSTISSRYSGAGGIVGTADTLQVVTARNLSAISAAEAADPSMPRIGAGGIAGGSGYAWLTSCTNSASVKGYEGVGGIIGSTRVKGGDKESFVYNQAYLRHCANSGEISGTNMTGGLVGEAQAGVESAYNTGRVSANDYVGGICGNTSVGVIQNVVNSASVTANSYVGGIVGKTTWGSVANCQNTGTVSVSGSTAGGILGMGGNNTMMHYCSNFGAVSGPSHATLGGIVGEIGDPREWTTTNIVECVVGSLEIAMGFIGPVVAYVEEAYELAHGVEIAIKLIEKGADLALISADYTLFGFGLPELISPEAEEALKATMESGANDIYAHIDSEISALRRSISPTLSLFPTADFTHYISSVEQLTAACADETVSEQFQDAINEARAERGEQLEKIARAQEIAHTVISGVAIAVSTATFIAGTVASGGAATAVLAVGTAASIVGGANALIKTCSEFENNAVVISQCVNAAPVTSDTSNTISSIAGKICDGVEVTDCLSTADTSEGSMGIFVGRAGNHADVVHCISAVDRRIPMSDPTFRKCLSACVTSDDSFLYPDGRIMLVAPERLTDTSLFPVLDLEVGAGKTWNIPAGFPFPIPEKSCYLPK